MLDIRVIRRYPEKIKEAMRKRNKDMDSTIDKILEFDVLRRETIKEAENLKTQQNKISKEIPNIKKCGGDLISVTEEMKKISQEVKKLTLKLTEIEEKQTEFAYILPNIPHESVPFGNDDNDNEEVRCWGSPTNFSYEPKTHWEIGSDLGLLDKERALKVTGSRFHFYVGLGARLERSVINYFLNTHTANGYTEILPPFMVNSDSMIGTGQLPKFSEDMYKIENEDFFLIPTAEVPVTNFYRNEILKASQLPLKYCAYSPCFRREKSSAGRDTRGLIRQHQFNKVELVEFVDPEKSYEEFENLIIEVEKVVKGLDLPYRVVNLCSGDIGFSSAKTYDIEVWMPSYNRYVEISSCSNYEDFQARRLSCRFKRRKGDKAQLVHTLNASGVAVGRTVAAILENYQNDDGTVTVPEVLRAMMGTDIIRK